VITEFLLSCLKQQLARRTASLSINTRNIHSACKLGL